MGWDSLVSSHNSIAWVGVERLGVPALVSLALENMLHLSLLALELFLEIRNGRFQRCTLTLTILACLKKSLILFDTILFKLLAVFLGFEGVRC